MTLTKSWLTFPAFPVSSSLSYNGDSQYGIYRYALEEYGIKIVSHNVAYRMIRGFHYVYKALKKHCHIICFNDQNSHSKKHALLWRWHAKKMHTQQNQAKILQETEVLFLLLKQWYNTYLSYIAKLIYFITIYAIIIVEPPLSFFIWFIPVTVVIKSI